MPEMQALLVGKRLLVAPLYIDDQVLAQIVLGERANQWPAVRAMLLREGMPDARRAMGGLYYLPAQLQFLDVREGVVRTDPAGYAEDGPANFGP